MKRLRVTRRKLLESAGISVAAILAAGRGASVSAASFDVTEKSIADLQAAMAAGRSSAAELTQTYLDRIAAYDQAGPAINAVVYVNPNALRDARALDAQRAAGRVRGPLHGIPVLLKDNYDTMDMPTTGASLALTGAVPKQDAFQVAKLRQAGCVLLGKVNLHELALGLTTHSSLGGQTLNPYDLTRGPGGSSGGSGAAGAADFAAFTMGTDTAGSIRVPSSHNSLVGLRPSAGLSSRAGIIPFGYTQDTGGPMAKTVTDIALVLDATVGYDPADPVTATGQGKTPQTYTSSLKIEALNGARIGVLNAFFGTDAEDNEVGDVVRAALADMRRLGATTVDITIPDLTAQLAASNLLSQELKFYLREYFKAQSGSWVKSVEELVTSGLLSNTLVFFLSNVANVFTQPENYLESEDYKNRLAMRKTLAANVTKVMDDNRLDAIAYPIARRIAPLLGGNQVGNNAGLSAQTGFPAINVPAGFTAGGFPVGIELLGRAFAEPTLLGLAYAFEQATHNRRPPKSTPPALPASRTVPTASSETGAGSVTGAVLATGRNSSPPSEVPFEAMVRWSFNPATRQFGYDITLQGASPDQVAGAYLHQRSTRPNGGVAHVLAKAGHATLTGRVTLTAAEADDLKLGRMYVALLSKASPLRSARADIVMPN
jgi:Asp-tRNA(Asn)/Glu-tRNA(Gln) amidotransferase A subunit family amidase